MMLHSDAPWKLLLLFTVGIFAGITNVLAGGGSLITIPLLIFLGCDGATANGTNRLSIVAQSISAVAGFKSRGVGDWRFSMLLVLPAIPGAILGAIYASTIDHALFRKVLAMVMIGVLILILTKRSGSSGNRIEESSLHASQKILAMLAFAGIGFYTGFIQAGVGFLIIGSLQRITGLDLVKINAHKVFVIGIITVISLFVFIAYDRMIWSLAIVLAAGNAIGGWLGSLAAVAGGEIWIKRVLVVATVAMAVKLLLN